MQVFLVGAPTGRAISETVPVEASDRGELGNL